jgi:hypothetical protein
LECAELVLFLCRKLKTQFQIWCFPQTFNKNPRAHKLAWREI